MHLVVRALHAHSLLLPPFGRSTYKYAPAHARMTYQLQMCGCHCIANFFDYSERVSSTSMLVLKSALGSSSKMLVLSNT